MTFLVNFAIISLSVIGLWLGAVWVVDSATKIAKKLGLSELVIGLTVVAIATSAPEFAVSVSAALSGLPSISVGNIVGSDIFNLGIILGIVALSSQVKTTLQMVRRDGFLLVGTSIMLLVFFYDLQLQFFEGILLFSTLLIYIFILIKQKQEISEELPIGDFKWYDILLLIGGVALIIFSANYLVDAATVIAHIFGVSDWLIGITIVAGGTSVPELATSIVALYKGRHGISAGNLIGSDLFNMLGVLGVASIIRPLHINQTEYTSLILLFASLVILVILMRTNFKISRWEGALLILIALFRWGFHIIF